MTGSTTRRQILSLLLMGSGLTFAACNASSGPAGAKEKGDSARARRSGRASENAMLVYRDPECGCCEAWAAIAHQAGYQVTVENHSDMAAIKARHRVPSTLASCHTAIVGGYAIEGHVPMQHIAKLLSDQPTDVHGIAVRGMPRGSPGMEMPDGSTDPFHVMAFDANGQISAFDA